MAGGRYILVILALVGIGCLMFALVRTRGGPTKRATQIKQAPIAESSPIDLRDYGAVRAKLQSDRIALWSRYQRARTPSEKATILQEAREAFERTVHDEIFPYWYGTRWDFYGTSENPGQGKIACGYFVSTVLRDLGMKVERSRLAQQASENIILSLTTNDHTRRFRSVPISSFVDAVKNWGHGLYVVGLDVHVGFILNVAGEVYFIHSSYADPYCVVKERAVDSQILTASRYRVLGKISEDDNLILKWLIGEQFSTRVG